MSELPDNVIEFHVPISPERRKEIFKQLARLATTIEGNKEAIVTYTEEIEEARGEIEQLTKELRRGGRHE